MSLKFFPTKKSKVAQILAQTQKPQINTQNTLKSNTEKLRGLTEQERSLIQINTFKANDILDENQNIKPFITNHTKHSSLDLEPFLIKSNSKIVRLSKIQSARQKKIIHLDMNDQFSRKEIENKDLTISNTNRHKNGTEEKLLDLLLLNTMELKKKLSIHKNEITVQKQRSKISINVNIKGLPSDFFEH